LKILKKNTTTRPTIDRPAQAPFTDKRLLRVKASSLITGRPMTPDLCTQLVLDIYDHEPPHLFDTDAIKVINDRRDCRDAPALSKWAVFELFSLDELVGQNCLGGGNSSGSAVVPKRAFDLDKMKIIKTAVFQILPMPNEQARKALWMKCVEKINTDVRYLFNMSMKKYAWLDIGLLY